jgi:hypothetical protein
MAGLMRPGVWQPPVACSRLEREVSKRVKRARLFVWLREHRHELLDEGFQLELATMYADRPVGQPPVPPAQLALATILQAYTGASDDEVIEATVGDGSALAVGVGLHGPRDRAVFEGDPGGVSRPACRPQPGPAAGGAHGGAVWAGDRAGGRGQAAGGA